MPGNSYPPYRAQCGGGSAFNCASGSHIKSTEKKIQKIANTTLASSLPCADPETFAAPTPRFKNEMGGSFSRDDSGCNAGVPVGQWPEPIAPNTFAPAAGEFLDLSVCQKKGFKNVYASRSWPGSFGWNSANFEPFLYSMNGDTSCQIPQLARNTPDGTKYLKLDVVHNATYERIATVPPDDPVITVATGADVSTCTVDSTTGKRTGSRTQNVSGDGGLSLTIESMLADKSLDFNKLLTTYNSYKNDAELVAPLTFTNGTTAAYSLTHVFVDGDITHTTTCSGSLSFSAGVYALSISKVVETDGPSYVGKIETTISASISQTTKSFVQTNITEGSIIDSGGAVVTYGKDTITNDLVFTLSVPFTFADVMADIAVLLATWNLGDDRVYPWRTTGAVPYGMLNTELHNSNDGVSGGPLVSRNDRGDVAPHLISEMTVTYNGDVISSATFEDTSTPVRPEMPDGGIIGAPNPVGSDPHFDFRHIDWEFVELLGGAFEGIAAMQLNFGQFSPFPHATQWLSNVTARKIPTGPFISYNAFVNPELVTSDGAALRLGQGVFVCKWAEVLQPNKSHNFFRPCGADRDLETSPGVLRYPTAWPICGRVDVISMTQNAGNVDVVLGAAAPYLRTGDNVDFTTYDGSHAETVLIANKNVTVTDSTHFSYVGVAPDPELVAVPTHCKSTGAPHYRWHDDSSKGDYVYKVWSFDFRDFLESYRQRMNAVALSSCGAPSTDPVRYVPQTMTPSEADEIGTGSHGLKTLTTTPSCLGVSPCDPSVIYISPNVETGHPASYTFSLPGHGLVADALYGSLWIGRIEQVMNDPIGTAGWEESLCAIPETPAGCPPLPGDVTPLCCPNFVEDQNTDPPGVSYDGSCYPQYNYSVEYNDILHRYEVFGEPQTNHIFRWTL